MRTEKIIFIAFYLNHHEFPSHNYYRMIFAFVKVILRLASVNHEQVATMYMTIPNWHWNVQHASMISRFPMQIQIGLQVEKAALGSLYFSAIWFEEFVSQITVTLDSVFKNQYYITYYAVLLLCMYEWYWVYAKITAIISMFSSKLTYCNLRETFT